MLHLIRRIRARIPYPEQKVKPCKKVHPQIDLIATTRPIRNIYVIDAEIVRPGT